MFEVSHAVTHKMFIKLNFLAQRRGSHNFIYIFYDSVLTIAKQFLWFSSLFSNNFMTILGLYCVTGENKCK